MSLLPGPGMTSAAGEAQAKKKRAKKQVVKVDFDGEHHFAELSKRGKVSKVALPNVVPVCMHACLIA